MTRTLVPPGVYRRDGEVYVVKENREHTRVYAKRLIQSAPRVRDADEAIVKADFKYDPGAIFNLEPDDQLTLEQAREYLVRYTHCMICGRELKAAKSVLDSIGPVCRGMFKSEPKPELDPEVDARLSELLTLLQPAGWVEEG